MVYWLLFLVFTGGFASLSLEMSASHLMDIYFGSTLFIWTCLIAIILLCLMVGYWVGGNFADFFPGRRFISISTAIAGFLILIIPFINQNLVGQFANVTLMPADSYAQSFLILLCLLMLPNVLLGFITPFAIRILSKEIKNSGRLSGKLYAISTLGSLFGTFITTIGLIPNIGTRNSILFCGVLLIVTACWTLHKYWRLLSVVPFLVFLIPMGPLKSDIHIIYEKESFYNYIQVHEDNGVRKLIVNDGRSTQSIYDTRQTQLTPTGRYWDYYLLAPYFHAQPTPPQQQRIAMVGLAGGSMAHMYAQAFGPQPIDGIEIDPEIVRVGKEYFGLKDLPINAITQDGRTYFNTSQKQYDIISMDAFNTTRIPFQLVTKEFDQSIANHLAPDGVFTLNIAYTDSEYKASNRLIQYLVNTLSGNFSTIYTISVPNHANTLIIATKQPTSKESLLANAAGVPKESTLGSIIQAGSNLMKVATPDTQGIFTDDWAPIEIITEQMLSGIGAHS